MFRIIIGVRSRRLEDVLQLHLYGRDTVRRVLELKFTGRITL